MVGDEMGRSFVKLGGRGSAVFFFESFKRMWYVDVIGVGERVM
jgi:hypothetical protein